MTKDRTDSQSGAAQRGPVKLSVLIADDHSLIADALRIVLETSDDFTVALCATLDDTLAALSGGGVDILMLDIAMPGMEGLSSVRNVVELSPETAVIVFSGTVDASFVHSAVDLGARGFISKGQPVQSLAATLRHVAAGNIVLPPDLPARNKGAEITLDGRERTILQAVSEGKTNREIATATQSTEVAIKMKMRAICIKLDAKNRAHAAMIARQRALI
ncbi:response regulator transcription factor [Celeribacter arenosi]|uniref:Response regulator transcription factor n=1 Tax=Celeribacter arenosi TaxID=792649 RepID=A0ABP7KBF0_9RHOB